MDQLHQVYARWDDTLWVGVGWMARRQELTTAMEYVTLPVSSHREVCLVLSDGRQLCDFGPSHEHTRPAEADDA